MAVNRPSLLDDEDFSAIGKSRGSAAGGAPSRARTVKLVVAGALFLGAAGAVTYPYWSPDRAVRDSRGEVVKPRTFSAEEEAALQREEREAQIFLEQGGRSGSE